MPTASDRARVRLPRRPSLWEESHRHALLGRLGRLSPAATPRWGRLAAPQMLAHLGDAARLALGEITAPAQNRGAARILRHAPAKHLLVYVLPFPHNVPRVRALFTTAPTTWTQDRDTLALLFERLSARATQPHTVWPEHPFFGRLSTRAWGVLGYSHTDHHLRQFGV